MEPASSSDDDSSIDEQSSNLRPSSSLSSSSHMNKNDDMGDIEVKDFDELPSDDSCLESESDSGLDSDSDSDSDDSSSQNNEEEEEIALGDRIYAKQHSMGVKRDKHANMKKSQALEIAQKRLMDMKRKRKHSKNNDDNDDSDDDNKNTPMDAEEEYSKRKKKKKSKSKHAPTVASSKRSDYYSRGAPDINSSGIGIEIGAKRYKPRDPRHESLSGHFDQSVFEKRYEFLEKMQNDEIEALKQRVKAWNTKGKKGQRLRKKLGMMSSGTDAAEDQAELNRLLQERAGRTEAKIRTAAKRSVKKKLREDVASGKRGAYYLKKRDLKKMELEAKFEELKKLGGDKKVNQVIAKRRKKKMGKDSSFMPSAT